MLKEIKPIAIHLPQFHPFPENDEWWGKGFTEWTNVTKARPLFEGHYQPHLPTDLGFYDLRLEEARVTQIELAKQYGIYGFCYYHYWFNGKPMMYEPIERMLANPKEDFPFMFCWANENWTRTWDGNEKDVLVKQNYSEADFIQHINYLIPFFQDKRYIKVYNKPVFIIYKSDDIPNLDDTIKLWNTELKKVNIEIYWCRIERWTGSNGKNSLNKFDAAIEFQPMSANFKSYIKHKDNKYKKPNILSRIFKKLTSNYKNSKFQLNIHDLEQYIDYDLNNPPIKDYKIYPCVSPMWDNTARKGTKALIFKNSTPKIYKKWLKGKLNMFKPFSKDENFIFINAWNEWAEGNHLEPCIKWGRQYLEATLEALQEAENK
ncbi:glycosyltransferase WbsX family protein [Pedobacter glucosidilyticus]|uniref:glycosyltransferase WbsX family protein n=1 Tax=Pedobacter glucosidilyticus TaxID=1122941 RepID=UPI000416073F|nr:glycoside hydrolase family 99-like domain-containing protein [Pedobacter glucosidilyticus]